MVRVKRGRQGEFHALFGKSKSMCLRDTLAVQAGIPPSLMAGQTSITLTLELTSQKNLMSLVTKLLIQGYWQEDNQPLH